MTVTENIVECVDVAFLKRTLREAFMDVDNAANELELFVRKTKVNFEYQPTTM